MAHREKEAEKLGTLVRPARQRMGWTQADLAERLGVDKGYISAIETGVRRWPLDHVETMAEALGLDIVEMAVAAGILPGYRRTGKAVADDFPPEDPAQEIIAALRKASYADRIAIRDYIAFQQATRRVDEPTEAPIPLPKRGRARTSGQGG